MLIGNPAPQISAPGMSPAMRGADDSLKRLPYSVDAPDRDTADFGLVGRVRLPDQRNIRRCRAHPTALHPGGSPCALPKDALCNYYFHPSLHSLDFRTEQS